jgi:hypothetical protein
MPLAQSISDPKMQRLFRHRALLAQLSHAQTLQKPELVTLVQHLSEHGDAGLVERLRLPMMTDSQRCLWCVIAAMPLAWPAEAMSVLTRLLDACFKVCITLP